ncbi:hypothetical protein HK099_004414 [Clydaea vesicula]|uniref:Uncharacterized protein n=1 Tax=Clydaea vesicula TaxID=447962 RepID=A0AAD5U700_9FUNG|nr:hypothetical protein HK099_004414 [Clydaea vesicula]KAJ3397636.1 hypothetical protein HDU92_005378 [Lobulomyces angularis]
MAADDTSAILPGLNVENFQWGMLMSCTFLNLLFSVKYVFMNKTGKLPFFIQLTWFISQIFWINYYFSDKSSVECLYYGIFMAIFDTVAKMLLVWYINVRLEVISSVNYQMNILRKIFVLGGLLTSILSNVLNWLPTWMNQELGWLTHAMAMALYLSADIIIAVQDIIVGILFVGKISNSNTFAEGLHYLRNTQEIKFVAVILSGSLIGSCVSFILKMEGVDGSTWAIYATYFAFKASLTAFSLELLVQFCINQDKSQRSEGTLKKVNVVESENVTDTKSTQTQFSAIESSSGAGERDMV